MSRTTTELGVMLNIGGSLARTVAGSIAVETDGVGSEEAET